MKGVSITTNLRQLFQPQSSWGYDDEEKKRELFHDDARCRELYFRFDAALGVHVSYFNDDISGVVVE